MQALGGGVDAAFQFYQNVAFAGYYARTDTSGLKGDDDSYQGQFDYAADRYGARVSNNRAGFTLWNPFVVVRKLPLASAIRWVTAEVNKHTRPSAETGAITAFATVCPAA